MRRAIFSLLAGVALQTSAQMATLDLSGTWRFQTDPMGFGMTPGSELYLSRLAETISLPGTMDEGGKGLPNAARYVDRLSRKFEYCGAAWYQRELTVPEAWKGKQLVLNLERCHWVTTVYVDGKRVGTEERLSTPHRFDLTAALTPGLHTLTVCVDNRLKYPMDQWNHGTTEYTQTNWNGMVGDLKVEVYDPARITALRTYPDLQQQAVRLKIDLDNATGKARKGRLQLELREKAGQKTVATAAHDVELAKGRQTWSGTLALGKEMKLWDEFSPFLYEVKATLTTDSTADERTVRFGMREVERGAHHVRLNGRDIHLRGALDCCVFPRTGYPAMQPDEWRRIFSTVKEYGMNHVRFHSWCPPEAAFEAADEVGIYLQAELPMWIKDVGKYPARRDFFEKELYAVLEEYGNHPSFLLMCNGNENEGDFAVLEDLIQKGQRHDNRHLYSASTARTHVKSDEFYVSHVSPKGGITVYEGIPSTDWDKDATSDIDCPVIAHETGQRCMYPNFKEMSKYTGVLQPRNFEVFRERLTRNGMLHQAEDFFRATGAHTVLQYKEVNESLLRTRKSGGFQLLGLSDFPGQGSAYVGILDAFWESKGLVTPEKFRESCAPTVLLARMPKRAYSNSENFEVRLEVYHYGQYPIRKGKLEWTLVSETGEAVGKGTLKTPAIPCATVDSLGAVSVPLGAVKKAGKLTLHARLGDYHNEWDIWVYPSDLPEASGNYVFARSYDDQVRSALAAGKSVLLVPRQMKGRRTRFASHFWNPIMFKWNPLIVGTLISRQHPAFADFPTSYYADWQWWDILNHAAAMELDGIGLTPVIQSIDSYETNHKLGIAFEARVGKGRIFVLNVDIEKDAAKRLATRQLLYSVRQYVGSERFRPSDELQLFELDRLFSDKVTGNQIQQNNAAIRQLLNQ